MAIIDDFNEVKDCIYKNEHYSVRDNGSVMRHQRRGKRLRKDDNVWTFGKPNKDKGYMEIAGQSVHRIVAFAFLGEPPTQSHVVDHIDTNRRNNRPENLRWVTRLENALNNPITRKKIEYICGSIEAFLANPSILRGHEDKDTNFCWMRTVSPKEARASLERMTIWAKENHKSKIGKLGEWIFKNNNHEIKYNTPKFYQQQVSIENKEKSNETKSLTPNAVQINWRIPSEFPCCPSESSYNPIEKYKNNIKKDSLFCKNALYSSLVMESSITDEGKYLWVMTRNTKEAVKPWALSRISYKDGIYIHENKGSFFREDGAEKYFTLAQGKEWTGGKVFDDYC